MVTKLAGPFSNTCRFSISPRSRLRLRPARRAALTMTLMRAEDSMFWGLRGRRQAARCRRGLDWVPSRNGAVKASFDVFADPFARSFLGLGAILGAEVRQRLVQLQVAFAGGFCGDVPFPAPDLVHPCALSAHH